MGKTVDLSTHLEAPPDKTWAAVKRVSTFAYITKGLMGFSTDGAPEDTWAEEGNEITLRLRAFHAVPLWQHTIRIETVDEERKVIQTRERGGIVKSWTHRITVEPEGDGTRYRDVVEIDAGPFTLGVWAFAQMMYRYRQARWRKLARSL